MSVIGIDFGNESCFVGVARGGGIETVDNDYSLRATPSTVAFGERQRILGVAAKNQLVTNIKNTVYGFKRLLARTIDDPSVQSEIANVPFKVVAHPDTNQVQVEVQYLGESQTFSMEQLTAMLFTKLKETTEVGINAKVCDCVISVPSYFTDAERRALLAAAQMAGLNVLRLMNETAATALNYGIYKQDLPNPEEEPRNVVFVDCGHSALQVFVCAFSKGKLKILASSADPYLGGRDFDRVLAAHFSSEFRQRYNIDPEKNHRAYVRLLTEVEKLKKQMSANATKLQLNIECLMDDKDVSSSMCRADFEAMSAPLFQRVEATLQTCLADSKLRLDQIHSVEIVGGSSRIPAIKQLIEKVFGKAPSTTLNQDEAVARGCALQCAILSPAYKVRDFQVTDVQPYPIKLIWNENDPNGFTEVFPKYHSVPFVKMISFHKRDMINLQAEYSSPVPFPNSRIGSFRVMNNPAGTELVKVKVKLRVNINGIFSISGATAYEKLEGAVGEESMDVDQTQGNDGSTENQSEPKQESNSQEGSQGSSQEGGAEVPMNQDEAPNGGDADKKKETKKPQVKLVELPVESQIPGLCARDIELMAEEEGQMVANDRKEKDRIDAKNALEEAVYLLRSELEGDLAPYSEDADRQQFLNVLNDLESWLYDEGSDETKHVYNEKLDGLRVMRQATKKLRADKMAQPIKDRRVDAQDRPKAIREFEVSLMLATKVVEMYKSKEPRYDHLESGEIEKIVKAVQDGEAWLNQTRDILRDVKENMTSPIKAPEIIQQRKAFESVVHPITNKPRPKVEPPKEEPPQEQTTESNANHAGDNTSNSNAPNSTEGQAMDVE